jgi:DNA-binding response OmpR family regulator
MLPNASGYEVLNRIRLKENHPPIIVLSAIATEDDPIIELRPGKVVYIMKGAVPLNTIATKIREYISSLASS